MFARLIADMRAEAQDAELIALIDACDDIGRDLMSRDADDRLAASYPFLTMLSTAVCGWLMERQGRVAPRRDAGRSGVSGDEGGERRASMSSRSCPKRWACARQRPWRRRICCIRCRRRRSRPDEAVMHFLLRRRREPRLGSRLRGNTNEALTRRGGYASSRSSRSSASRPSSVMCLRMRGQLSRMKCSRSARRSFSAAPGSTNMPTPRRTST